MKRANAPSTAAPPPIIFIKLGILDNPPTTVENISTTGVIIGPTIAAKASCILVIEAASFSPALMFCL